jgi:hypothetical protein
MIALTVVNLLIVVFTPLAIIAIALLVLRRKKGERTNLESVTKDREKGIK